MSGKCECHMMEALAETAKYSVEFNQEQCAYFLNGDLSISHCIFCGGELPDPVREYRAPVQPDPNEEQEANAAVRAAANFDDLRKVIGEPDEIDNNEPTEFCGALLRMMKRHPGIYISDPQHQHVRVFRYAKRWKSLCLDVYEYADGRLEPSVVGLRPDEFVIVKQRSWWSRLSWLTKRRNHAMQRSDRHNV